MYGTFAQFCADDPVILLSLCSKVHAPAFTCCPLALTDVAIVGGVLWCCLQAAAAGALRNLAVNEQLEGHLLAAGTVQVLLELVANARLDVGVRTAALEGLRCARWCAWCPVQVSKGTSCVAPDAVACS